MIIFLCLALMLSLSTAEEITVAAASNLQFALEEVKNNFTQETQWGVKTVYGSTGKLAAQIKSGAPFDIFVAASTAEPESLYTNGLTNGAPRIFTYGLLVLWTLQDADLSEGMAVLKNPRFKKIALPDPKLAPYGKAAVTALQKEGLYEVLKTKLIFGDNITQTAQYIVSGNADIGFNAKSIVLSGPMQGKGHWVEVDSTLYTPIRQGVVQLKYGAEQHPEASKRFLEYLFSKNAGEIFKKYGYRL
ncbi:MAG: molybdate ABC transporter substrate-binding protein [Elusimicrobia bacterium RIFOXYB2_FULL_49_7]|nr:MAG: molybdate ABC transporter substrate-binding protein [Elusimicrobia bacterium RIFOXYB2_FULL_49_7]